MRPILDQLTARSVPTAFLRWAHQSPTDEHQHQAGCHLEQTYKKLEMPVLGLGSTGYGWLQAAVTPKATNFRLVKIENSGHFMQEEQPEVVAQLLIEFFN
jgi:pimeloyl-ACP methyl ester carboxylesterase